MHRPTNNHMYRLLSFTLLIFVVAGSVLTVVGNTALIKSCKIAGPVVITVGGLLLFFITASNSRQDLLIAENTNCEEPASSGVPGERSNNELGPIHHFEIKIPCESFGNEIIPPSYEEAVSVISITFNDIESLKTTEQNCTTDGH